MRKFFTIQSILIAILGIFLIGGILISKQRPVNNDSFQKGNASFDTTSFSQYERGVVEQVIEERIDEAPQNRLLYQRLKINLDTGVEKGNSVETEFTQVLDSAESIRFKVGEKVVLGVITPQQSGITLDENALEYVVVDRYRMPGLLIAGLVLVALAFIFGRIKGLLSIAGLGITAAVLIFFTAPQLLAGKNPVLIAGVSAGVIAITTMFIAHGFRLRTKISIVSTLISLACSIALSYLLVYAVKLFGLGQSDAFLLQAGYLGVINLQGLLLAGLIISLLGVLDDVTTAQTATVEELLKANSDLSFEDLYNSAMSVGREHIASLINTLILVYVGAGLPLFLLLVSASNQPIWVMLNSENISEEIVRAIAGSLALVLAVPISTLIAAYIYKSSNKNI